MCIRDRIWIKHEVFGKVLVLLPFGFLIGWIFFVPVLSLFFQKIYDLVASNRTEISKFLRG